MYINGTTKTSIIKIIRSVSADSFMSHDTATKTVTSAFVLVIMSVSFFHIKTLYETLSISLLLNKLPNK